MPKSTEPQSDHLVAVICLRCIILIQISKRSVMQKEKWLNTLIFDTGLFDITILSNEEKITIRKYLQDKKTVEEIAKKSALPVDDVKNILKTGIEKILLISKELLAKSIWFREMVSEKELLQHQLATIRERFKKELADEELTAAYERLNIPVSNLSFSTRAKTVFRGLNVKTLNDLANLTLKDLSWTRNAGPVAINEIVKKALEFGIIIT
jgi:hypothetical protein